MVGDRPRYGPLVSAAGAILLAVSIFLPWYGVSFTEAGIALAQQQGESFVAQFGNAALQGEAGTLHASLGALAGHRFLAVSAHPALTDLNVVLLIVAGLAIVIALLALAGAGLSSAEGHRGPLTLLGAVGAICVLYRMIQVPEPAGKLLSLSLREGAWLALIGSAAIVAGALWPRARAAPKPTDASVQSVWSELSGWTPEA
jgi:hypothetical protein